MARTFNPQERESSVLHLFGTDYEVAEATRRIMRRIQGLQAQIEQLGDDPEDDAVVTLLADQIEAGLVSGEGAADQIRGAWERDEISLPALVRTVEFVGEELRGSALAGEA